MERQGQERVSNFRKTDIKELYDELYSEPFNLENYTLSERKEFSEEEIPFAFVKRIAEYFKVMRVKSDLEEVIPIERTFADTSSDLPVCTYGMRSSLFETPLLPHKAYEDLANYLIGFLFRKVCITLYLCHIKLVRFTYLHKQYKQKRLYQWIFIIKAAIR